ncbi:septal ring lytic transglycosylase RlpA family protein [Pontibacter sp. BT310]|uniref:Probable endolytic peptidoglycan transglycosylase RlpA n=1 Tax=Pontibacter populi TaxID=890055 RepID=A0ABS6XBR3_9BACT|nr:MULTISPECIES: septal ring lytic transglycosylase RlpA family protein [Pontibacter]MBJ6117699.1 septal ring lytic transglycosylase RlpA family protein [Pontibacter sp. BT310]MBW3364551.1 septal ring lytic transglycosylase RlpA family protein [Pontibacter populi]
MLLTSTRSRSVFMYLLIVVVCLSLASCAGSKANFGQKGYTEEGKASYYSRKLQGRKMANGEPYRHGKLTAAHKKLPFGTKVKVTNLATNKSVKVKITDRGPFVQGRIVDLSGAAAKRVGMMDSGVAPVKMKVIRSAAKK